MDFRRMHDENVTVEHTVEFEKGIKTSIAVHEYADHYTKDTVFGITEIFLHNMPDEFEYPVITVFGAFRKPYERLGVDPISGLQKQLYFVIGDVRVPAECLAKYEYQGLLIPNLPGEVDFFVSLNGMTPVSQVVRLTFPKTKKSQIRSELEEKLAKLLVTNDNDYRKLMRKLGKCDNKQTHSEKILREYLKDWLFDGCRTVNAIDRKGLQVVHLFASLGYAWAIPIFKRFGFSLNSKDEKGWTPMHWAAFYGRKGVATALIVGRADPTIVTTPTSDYSCRSTAADIAFEEHHYHLASYLELMRDPEKRENMFTHPTNRDANSVGVENC